MSAWLEGGPATLERSRRRWPLVDLGTTMLTRPNYANDTLLYR